MKVKEVLEILGKEDPEADFVVLDMKILARGKEADAFMNVNGLGILEGIDSQMKPSKAVFASFNGQGIKMDDLQKKINRKYN